MAQRIDTEQLERRQRFTFFHWAANGVLCFWVANAYGLLFQLKGLWAIGWLGLVVLLCHSAPMLFTGWLNLKRGSMWYEGFNPDLLVLDAILLFSMLTGIVLQAYRAGIIQ